MLQILILLCIILPGCSSTQDHAYDGVHPAAIERAYFNVDTPAPEHESTDTDNSPFFHKACEPAGGGSHHSKTSYFCETR